MALRIQVNNRQNTLHHDNWITLGGMFSTVWREYFPSVLPHWLSHPSSGTSAPPQSGEDHWSGLRSGMHEENKSFLPSLDRRILKEKSIHHLPSSNEGLKIQWGWVLFRGKGQKEKRELLQVGAREIADSSKEEILRVNSPAMKMATQRSTGVPRIGGTQNFTGQDSELFKSISETW